VQADDQENEREYFDETTPPAYRPRTSVYAATSTDDQDDDTDESIY
jgi:hypothetical protein